MCEVDVWWTAPQACLWVWLHVICLCSGTTELFLHTCTYHHFDMSLFIIIIIFLSLFFITITMKMWSLSPMKSHVSSFKIKYSTVLTSDMWPPRDFVCVCLESYECGSAGPCLWTHLVQWTVSVGEVKGCQAVGLTKEIVEMLQKRHMCDS